MQKLNKKNIKKHIFPQGAQCKTHIELLSGACRHKYGPKRNEIIEIVNTLFLL